MSKHYSNKRRLKYVFVAFACAASFSLTGLAAACKTDDTTETEKTTSVEDTQLLKNGNFEFFTVPDQNDGEPAPEYLINTPNNWTKGGTTPYTMSGVIGTSDAAWDKLTADDLADRLDANNALDSTASNYSSLYIDFNGMKSTDLLYKDTYSALNYSTISSSTDDEDATTYYIGESDAKIEIYYDEDNDAYYYDAEHTKPVSKDFIENPLSHNIFKDDSGVPYYVDGNGERQEIVIDENGNYYLEYDSAKDEYSQSVGHVLMLHNYSNSNHNGIAQNYASVDVSLPANTAAEISVWVKTTGLYFSQGQSVNEDQDHGANITVTHTAGTSTLDDFSITCINTEKLISSGKASKDYNGWVEYTVYINACDFASSTVTVKLGLGETDSPVEGYAFFDDVTVTKYIDLSDENCSYSDYASKIEADKAYCTLTSTASEKIFAADTYERNGGAISEERFSNSFHYFIDLASESKYLPVDFNSTVANAGLTVDSDNYVSSKTADFKNITSFNNSFDVPEMTGNAKLPDDLKNLVIDGKGANPGLDTSGDLLALVNAGYKFTESQTKYSENLNKALETAASLPRTDEDSSMFVLFSAKGAAYTASFDLEIAPEGYQIISFWVKTSDMNGATAATVKISEKDNEDNSANVTLDTTDIVTDIDDDNKDIYNGWVQCFFFVHNDTPDKDNAQPAALHIEFSFSNTTISGTTVTSYKPGWAALANIQTLNVDEDVFAYTGSGTYTASLTITEEEKKNTSVFDNYMEGQKTQIETGFADPASYTGTNGGSSKVATTGVISPFDGINPSETAGLINRDYVDSYSTQVWYQNILDSFGLTTDSPNYSATDALANWYEIFGSKSVQPLIISNTWREGYILEKNANEETFKKYWYYDSDKQTYIKVTDDDTFDEDKKYYSLQEVLNYGFIGDTQTITSETYSTVTVRVKVSKGAVAYIYLVDTTDTTKVLGFDAPSYTFWYDADGNVLKAEIDEKASLAEQRDNVLYTLRDDGLYLDKDGTTLRANIWNYAKSYVANITYYTKDGGKYSIDELVDGVDYYEDEACIKLADCFLVTPDGTKVYEFKNEKYYYIVNGVTQTEEVKPFETEYARYDYTGVSEEYTAVVEDTEGKWVTVNFVIHAGSESKTYRLELWSGQRGEYETEGNEEGGSVIFDYSYTSITSDDLLDQYENEIIKAYQSILAKHDLLNLSSSDLTIKDYKELVEGYIEDGKIPQQDVDDNAILNNYVAHYFTYSLYDSADYRPFNKETADANSTGYNYSVDDYQESLAYLSVMDYPAANSTEGYTYTVFIDYSTINQSIELDTGEDEEEDEEESDDSDSVNVWLLASSIVLVAALLFAMGAILIKDTIKKTRRNKVLAKNNFNSSKTKFYIRKLGIKKEEIEEVDAPSAETPAEENNEEPVEEVVEQPAEEVTEAPAEETVEPETTEEPTENNENPENGQE